MNQAHLHTSRLLSGIALFLTAAAFCGCGTANVSNRREIKAPAKGKPVIVYIADFDLDTAAVKSQQGILPAMPRLPGPMGDMLPTPPGAVENPAKVARNVIDSMSNRLVSELNKAGVPARRITSSSLYATNGWLVRGVFTEVNQGNQLRRAVIGFGVGRTDLQVNIDLSDLSQGPPKSFYELSACADSGKAPGAGPTIVLGPAGIAARFVIAGKDLDRNVKQAALKIADEVVQRTKTA